MKKIVLLILFCMVQPLVAEDLPGVILNNAGKYIDANTKKIFSGTVKQLNASDNTRVETVIKSGLKNKELTYKDEKLFIESNYEKGLKSGIELMYYPDGTVWRAVTYKDGKKHGKTMDYADNGVLISEENYVYGKKDGKTVNYHNNGTKKSEVFFRHGKIEGVEKTFNSNGRVISEIPYSEGKSNGSGRFINYANDSIVDAFFENGKMVRGVCITADGKHIDLNKRVIDKYNKDFQPPVCK